VAGPLAAERLAAQPRATQMRWQRCATSPGEQRGIAMARSSGFNGP
jgi:hypothetical protein